MSKIDSGDETPLKNRAPILVNMSGSAPWPAMAGAFDLRSGTLEPALRQLVHDRLMERLGAG